MNQPSTSAGPAGRAAARDAAWPENPILVRLWRGAALESVHRGAWALSDAGGRVLDGAGAPAEPVFVRSSVKSLQALPLLESGAARRWSLSEQELALALASHDGEPQHVERVAALLARLGLTPEHLQCGPQPPGSAEERARLAAQGLEPTRLHNNCSGKHAGFLALALHTGVDPARYLDPQCTAQRLVRQAVLEMTGLREEQLSTAVDGCSAPTFRLPLTALATAFARVGNPQDLPPVRREACERMLDAAAAWPELVGGQRQRLCTGILRVTRGRLFPKVGGEAVYAIGVRGAGRGLAIKIDDGAARALHPLVIGLLRRLKLASAQELAALAAWEQPKLSNWAGLEVGRTEVLV